MSFPTDELSSIAGLVGSISLFLLILVMYHDQGTLSPKKRSVLMFIALLFVLVSALIRFIQIVVLSST